MAEPGDAPTRPADAGPRFERGLALRRRVLGADYVDAALASADAATRPIQDFVTEYAWGAIWSRPGLELRTRSLITLAMLVGLNQPAELRLHIEAAQRNGCTPDEIRETLLHAAIYLGVPAALAALAIARDVLPASS
ncbi:MAG: 4-carboxymuconolactone decarboxylase [Chloroflexota bacterium]|nr:4-carboxymuconolactone decarboxylase [Chloroflexota bacterium]MEA2607694.1 4-carboxymuconolactone decarboxylase [Chloroflexota bacterium]